MYRVFIVVAALVAFAGVATAQVTQQRPAPPPSEQALGTKLFKEMSDGLVCEASRIDLERQLADARKQIEELKKTKE